MEVPAGFSDELLLQLDFFPMALTFTPDGRMFLLSKGGDIWIYAGAQLLPAPLLSIPVSTEIERGLINIALDPEFGTNGFFYVYYVTAPGSLDYSGTPRTRISRFQVVVDEPDRARADSEVIILDDITGGPGFHNGGCFRIGSDGKLYLGTGDAFFAPGPQALGDYRGKILRLDLDGSAPSDNPFVGDPGARPEVWALGLRNPFRCSFDPFTGNLWVGDVGADSWEELNLGIAGANYGWPQTEGFLPPGVEGVTYPIHAYPQGAEWPSGAAIIIGPTYNGSMFPPGFVGSLFFADWVGGVMWRVIPDPEAPNGIRIAEFGKNKRGIVDMTVGPDGALYYLSSRATDAMISGPDNPELRRVVFDPDAKKAPWPQAAAFPTSGLLPLTVHFSSEGSLDPESEPLAYEWHFGDGATSAEPHPQHIYAAAGIYSTRLTVSTPDGRQAASVPIAIHAGNEPPLPLLQDPREGDRYRAGDVITFAGSAIDPQEGPLPPAALSWRIAFHHDEHAHTFLGPLSGMESGQFTVPVRGERSANTWFRVFLTATDSAGLSATTATDIFPRTATVTLDTSPPGLNVILDGAPHFAPLSFTGVVGFERDVSVEERQLVAGKPHVFAGWSHGAPASFVLSVPEADATFTAHFEPVLADLQVGLQSPAQLFLGQTLEYDLTVVNAGPSAATEVVLQHTLPGAAELLSLSASHGSCTAGPVLLCAIPTLAVGEQAVFRVTLEPDAIGSLALAAEAESFETDPQPADNVMDATVDVLPPQADLRVTAALEDGLRVAGSELVYTFTIGNHGPSPAASARLTLTMDPGAAVISAAGPEGPCAPETTCALGTMPAGASVTVTLRLKFSEAVLATQQGTAASNTFDPDSSNNAATVAAQITDFAVSASPAVLALRNGTGTLTVLVAARGGAYDQAVQLACAPAGQVVCRLAHTEVVPGQGHRAVSMTVELRRNSHHRGAAWHLALLLLAGVLGTGASAAAGSRCKKRRRAGIVLALLLALLLPSCGAPLQYESVPLEVTGSNQFSSRSAQVSVLVR